MVLKQEDMYKNSAYRSLTMIPCYRPYFGLSEFMAMIRPSAGRREFELKFTNYVGARYGVAFPSGRDGVFATLKALKLYESEVILPAYTCEVVARAVLESGNRPVFVDINLSDYNMDIKVLRQALTNHTSVVIATHLYGYPTKVDLIRSYIGDHRIIILEDCAQRLPPASSYSPGLKGDVAIYSSGRGKPMCTIEGGMVTTNSTELYERIKIVRDEMFNKSLAKISVKRLVRMIASYLVYQKQAYRVWCKIRKSFRIKADHRSNQYSPIRAGTPVGFTDFQGRVGLAQIGKLDAMIARQRDIADLYDHELIGTTGFFIAPRIDGGTYSFYTIRVPQRDEIHFKERMALRGVSVDQSYNYALPHLKTYQPFSRTEYPRAVRAAKEVINLPCHPGLTDEDVRYVAGCVRACI